MQVQWGVVGEGEGGRKSAVCAVCRVQSKESNDRCGTDPLTGGKRGGNDPSRDREREERVCGEKEW